MRQQASVRYKDPKTGKTWIVVHKARSEYDIKRKCPRRVSEGGWTRLGSITRYCEPRGNGLRWVDLGSTESAECYSSLKKCLLAFITELSNRHNSNKVTPTSHV